MKRISILAPLATFVAIVACSEAKDPDESDTAGAGAATGNGGGSSTTTTGGAAGHAGGNSDLVINEISASGDDYVELFNTSAETIATDGLRVADDDAGAPKLSEAVDLGGGSVAPGGYLFILAGLDTAAMPGPQTQCAPGPAPCFQAIFGISGSGDTIYLLDAGDGVLASAAYPMSGVPSGQSWSRLPDGTGDFSASAPTPGAMNLPPP